MQKQKNKRWILIDLSKKVMGVCFCAQCALHMDYVVLEFSGFEVVVVFFAFINQSIRLCFWGSEEGSKEIIWESKTSHSGIRSRCQSACSLLNVSMNFILLIFSDGVIEGHDKMWNLSDAEVEV